MEILNLAEIVIVPITIALITACSGAFMVILSSKKQSKKTQVEADQFRQENTDQHYQNAKIAKESVSLVNESRILLQHLSTQIGGIDQKVDKLDDRLDDVQLWQANHEKIHMTQIEANKRDL